jgi:transposase
MQAVESGKMKTHPSPVANGSTVAQDRQTRRHRSKLERRQIVEETLAPGASVAVIAREHGVNANQVFHWRRLYRDGLLDSSKPGSQFVPVRIIDAGPGEQGRATVTGERHSGTIDIQIGGVRVRITGSADPECVRAALEQLR